MNSNKEESINLKLFSILVAKHLNFLTKHECEILRNFCITKLTHKLKDHCAFNTNSKSTHGNGEDKILTVISKNIKELKKIEKRIEIVLDEYTESCNMRKVLLANSWINIQEEKSVLKEHIHPNSVLSAAIFINVDEESSPLVFENPNPYAHFFANKIDDLNSSIKPKNGMMIIFPSWLKHGSNFIENKTKDRIVISFNTNFKEFILNKTHVEFEYS